MIDKTIKKSILIVLIILTKFINAQVHSPEYTSFEPVNASNMVELQTGDFIYNIPLITVPGVGGGYPVNLFYHGGIQMEQEGSWTGLGWNINAGSIERNVKGYPDDIRNGAYSNITRKDNSNSPATSNFVTIANEKTNWKISKGNVFGFSVPYISHKTNTSNNNIWADVYADDYNAYGPLYFKDARTLATEWGTQEKKVIMDSYSNLQNSSTANDWRENDKANNVSFPNYDEYIVSANGLSGSMSPRLFEFGTLCGRGYVSDRFGTSADAKTAEEMDYTNRFPFSKTPDQIYFYFNNENSSYLKEKYGVFAGNGGSDPIWSNTYSGGGDPDPSAYTGAPTFYNSTTKRKGGVKYVQWYTNANMQSNQLTLGQKGIMEYKKLQGQRSDEALFDPTGIGGYSITDENGVTFHYALPVYNFSESRVDENLSNPSEDYFVNNTTSKYATSWLLTAITGPDFIDKGEIGIVDDADEGYWVRFDYGKWSDGYMWQTPYSGYDLKPDNRGTYAFGRKQMYYLNYIRTKTHTAYFVKELREDALGKDQFAQKTHLDITAAFPISDGNGNIGGVGIRKYSYNSFATPEKHKLLRLAKIILVKNEDLTIASNSGSALISTKTGNYYNTTYNIVGTTAETIQNQVTTTLATFNMNYNDNVIDVNDIQGLDAQIQAKAVKVINFDYDYSLCKNTPNGAPGFSNGKLTLKSVGPANGANIPDLPKYKFDYYNSVNYVQSYKDDWGYYTGAAVESPSVIYKDKFSKPDANAWSLKEILTPMGGKIKVGYESDTYSKEAALTTQTLSLSINNLVVGSNSLTMRPVLNLTNESPAITFTVGKYYNIRYMVSKQMNPKDPANPTGDYIPAEYYSGYNKLTAVNLATNQLTFEIYGSAVSTATTSASVDAIKYPLSNNSNGGGIRVSKIESVDENNVSTAITYDYTDPATGYSSGVTSYSPAQDESRYIPYQYELPAPFVMYKYITVKNIGSNGVALGMTRHKFKVYDDNANLNNLDYTVGDLLSVVNKQPNTEIFTSISSSAAVHSYARSALVSDFTSSLGQPLSVQTFDPHQNLLSETTYEYFKPEELNSGVIQETFATVKQLTHWDQARHTSYSQFHYLCSSSKIIYPCVLKSVTTNQKGIISTVTNTLFDFNSGAVVETEQTNSLGEKYRTKVKPAFTKSPYTAMGSKVTNDTYKNMLAPLTANYKYFVDGSGTEKLIGASADTWKNTWTYRDFISSQYTDNTITDVWRKHQSYVWKSDVNKDGTISNGTFVDFNWSGSPNAGWIKNSEVTRYDHYSDIMEAMDVNGNYSSSKKGDVKDNIIVSTSSTSDYTNFVHTSFEEADNGFVGGEVSILSCSQCLKEISNSTIKAHTGNYYLKVPGDITGPAFTIKNTLKNGKTYEASVWLHKNSHPSTQLSIVLDGTIEGSPNFITAQMGVSDANAIQIGDWKLLKIRMTIPPTYVPINGPNGFNCLKIQVLSRGGNSFADDFRVQFVDSEVKGYIYDKSKRLLTATLDNENFGTFYTYDFAGRLIKIEKETALGIKKISETNYHYGRP